MDEALRTRFKQAREAAGLSQGDVARHFGVDRGTAHRWECGHTRIQLDVAVAAAELFRCDRVWLVFGDGEAPSAQPAVRASTDLDDDESNAEPHEGAA